MTSLALLTTLSVYSSGTRRAARPFPTRRSSDLRPGCREHRGSGLRIGENVELGGRGAVATGVGTAHERDPCHPLGDRKSTRLNSSHVASSYAVFCLKNKK